MLLPPEAVRRPPKGRARRLGRLSRWSLWAAFGLAWRAAVRRVVPLDRGPGRPPPILAPRRKASLLEVFKGAMARWVEDEATSRAAALSYYAAFSMAPLVLIIAAVVGLLLGQEAAEGLVSAQLRGVMGPQEAQAVEGLVASAKRPGAGIAAGLIGFVVLLLGATAVVGELQSSLMKMWGTIPKKSGLALMIKNRLLSAAFVLALAFLLLVSLVLSSATSAAGRYLSAALPLPEFLLQGLNSAGTFATVALVFALMFKFLPRAKIAWKDVWIGAAATAVLFTLGNWLLGLYLGKAGPTTTYGAAGSLLAFLLWTFYCSLILYFGAEFTRVYAERRGSGFLRGAAPSL